MFCRGGNRSSEALSNDSCSRWVAELRGPRLQPSCPAGCSGCGLPAPASEGHLGLCGCQGPEGCGTCCSEEAAAREQDPSSLIPVCSACGRKPRTQALIPSSAVLPALDSKAHHHRVFWLLGGRASSSVGETGASLPSPCRALFLPLQPSESSKETGAVWAWD